MPDQQISITTKNLFPFSFSSAEKVQCATTDGIQRFCIESAHQQFQLFQNRVLINAKKASSGWWKIRDASGHRSHVKNKYEFAETTLYQSLQRCHVMWTELLAKQVSLTELQAYIVLRVAKLIPDDKKRVIVKSKDAMQSGLTTTSTSHLFGYISKGKNTNANATTLFRQIKRKTNMFFS